MRELESLFQKNLLVIFFRNSVTVRRGCGNSLVQSLYHCVCFTFRLSVCVKNQFTCPVTTTEWVTLGTVSASLYPWANNRIYHHYFIHNKKIFTKFIIKTIWKDISENMVYKKETLLKQTAANGTKALMKLKKIKLKTAIKNSFHSFFEIIPTTKKIPSFYKIYGIFFNDYIVRKIKLIPITFILYFWFCTVIKKFKHWSTIFGIPCRL